MNRLLAQVQSKFRPLIENNPYVQYCAFHALCRCSFLLPHDADYRGIVRLPICADSGGILDVGANLGLSALGFRKLAPGVRILSLEPNLLHEPSLARIKRRDADFDYRMVGAGEAADTMVLHVPYYGRLPLHTMASLNLPQLERACRDFYGERCRLISFRSVSITIVPIDQLQLSPALIKIDAEGHELSIVKGAIETIRRARPFLLVENNPNSFPAVMELLTPLGYRPYAWDAAANDFKTHGSESRNVYLLPGSTPI